MGLLGDIATYLRVGVPAVGVGEAQRAALQKYSSYETLAPAWSITDLETFVRDGHRKNALVFACIEYVARAIATPILEAVKETADGYEELPPLDPLTRLLERPSEDYPSQTRFFRQLVRALFITGEAIYYKVPGDRTGRIVELQMLPSNKVSVERKANGEKVYLYHYDASQPPKRLKAEEVLHVKFDDVLDRDRGLAPLAAAARETDVDNATADIRKTFFQEGAILEGILTTEQQANEKQLKEWSTLWSKKYGGPKNAGKTPALAGGLSYETIGATPDKWAFKEVTGLSEARICSAFGVPPILVGAKIGLDRSTYANYKEARSAFWEDTATPLLVFLADEFTGALTDVSDRRMCRWNTDEVPALQEDADSREERAGRGLEKGAVTIDEYREAAGLEPLEGDQGKFYMMPAGITLVAVGEIGVEEPEPEEEDPEEEPDAGEDSPIAEEDPTQADGVEAQRGLGLIPEEHSGQIAASLRISQAPLESRESDAVARLRRLLARAIEAVLGVQAESVAERVNASPEGEIPDAGDLFDLAVEAQRMAEAVIGHIRQILAKAGAEAAEDQGGDFDDEDLGDVPDEMASDMGRSMADTTRGLVQDAVDEGRGNGWSNEEIAERLRVIVLDRDRANLSASAATVTAANRAARSAYEQNGSERVVWRNGGDPCEFCAALEGREVGVGEVFAEVGDEVEGSDGGTFTVTYQTVHAPGLHPWCDCYVEPVKE